MQQSRQPQPVGMLTDACPAWLWRDSHPPIGHDAMLHQLSGAIGQKAAIHLYGPAGRGKATLAAHLAQDHTAAGGRVLWLEVGARPLAAILRRIARIFRDDPRAQAVLKDGMQGEQRETTAPLDSLARCLRERQPLLVLVNVPDYMTIAPLITETVGALPILSLGERSMGAAWPGEERALPALSTEAATATLRRAAAGGEHAELSSIAAALKGEALALVLCGAAIRAGDWSFRDAEAALKDDTFRPTERVLRTVVPRLAPAVQGALLLLAFGPRAGQSFALLQRGSGTTQAELAQLLGALRERALVREWAQDERIALPEGIRRYARELALVAGTAVELSNRAEEVWFEQLRSVLAGGADTWTQLPELLLCDEWQETASSTDWSELAPLWETAATEFEARGYAYELHALRQRAGITMQETAPPAPTPLWGDEPSAIPAHDPTTKDIGEPEAVHTQEEAEFLPESDTVFPAGSELVIEDRPEFPLGLDDEDEPDVFPTVEESDIVLDSEAALPEEAERIADTLSPLLETGEGEAASVVAPDFDPIFGEEPSYFPEPQPSLADEASPAEQLAQLHLSGAAQLERGEIDAAISSLSAALDLADELADDANYAEILYQLGCAQLEDGAIEAALSSLAEAHKRYEASGDATGVANALGALGSALGEQGRWPEAAAAHRSAVAATRAAGDQTEEALQLSAIAYAYRRSGQLGAAVRSYRQALYLAYEAADANGIAHAAAELAEVLMNSPRHLSIARLLLDEAIGAGRPDQDATELRTALEKALAGAEAAGVTQAPVRGDAYTYARQAYEALNAQQKPA